MNIEEMLAQLARERLESKRGKRSRQPTTVVNLHVHIGGGLPSGPQAPIDPGQTKRLYKRQLDVIEHALAGARERLQSAERELSASTELTRPTWIDVREQRIASVQGLEEQLRNWKDEMTKAGINIPDHGGA